jgi:hypothetical protein
MRPYGSRDDAIPAAEVLLSLSQSQSPRNLCEPLRGLEGTARAGEFQGLESRDPRTTNASNSG